MRLRQGFAVIDVRTIVRVQGDTLDRVYLATWATQLELTALWGAAARGEQAPHRTATHPAASDDEPRQTKMDL